MPTLEATFKLYDGYNKTISQVIAGTDKATNKILKASGATDTFNTKLSKSGASAGLAAGGISKLAVALGSLITVKKAIDITDSYANTGSRLALINDGLQTQVELQEKIFNAAERSRGKYADMASAVSKMGMLAGDAFGSNDELIGFTELVQKSFRLGGSSVTEQQSAMLQLSQAMAAGRLQGDEFRSIIENAPKIAEAIAKYTGKSKGELKALSSKGMLTADIIKNAMFGMSDDINNDLKKMKRTFGDVWNDISNNALKKFEPTMEKISDLINNPKFDAFTNSIINGINGAANGVLWLINGFIELGTIIDQNREVAGLFVSILGGSMIGSAITNISTLAKGLFVTGGLLSIGIGLTMGLAYAWITFGDWFNSVMGNVYGTVYVITGAIVNAFIGVGYTIDNIVKAIFNSFVWLTNSTIDLLNMLPGVNLGKKDYWKGFMPEAPFLDLNEEFKTGYQSGSYGSKGMSNGISTMLDDLRNMFNGEDVLGSFGDFSKIDHIFKSLQFGTPFTGFDNPIEVTGKGGKAVEINMDKQDLQYLKDIAEREYINKFSTATLAPNTNIQFTGPISKETDVDMVAKHIRDIMIEEIEICAEG
ncbi:phage tail tape measure protein [Sporanaerobium hydrogeniformans]|uniref:Phage tail tape measure protein n=1 Tax=Sporanaerobium hydrogeniformans TaxID=3072179 RepID=A0AC61DIW4_9FIRM|nr:tape measure protein [Sporanaerobium hydrogeniformans]PHV72187.1 phage tail tape measure protein [Sporanaerobium hydrogeniformans]